MNKYQIMASKAGDPAIIVKGRSEPLIIHLHPDTSPEQLQEVVQGLNEAMVDYGISKYLELRKEGEEQPKLKFQPDLTNLPNVQWKKGMVFFWVNAKPIKFGPYQNLKEANAAFKEAVAPTQEPSWLPAQEELDEMEAQGIGGATGLENNELQSCPQCDESAFDGQICHICGTKTI